MKKNIFIFIFFIVSCIMLPKNLIRLPEPKFSSNKSLEELLHKRKTVRKFKNQKITINDISQILWAANGISATGATKKTIPSAGALYPVVIYIVIGENSNEKIKAGNYLYIEESHSLKLIKDGELRKKVAKASLSQMWMEQAPIMIIIALEFERTTVKYGARGERYAIMESGNSSQNIFLESASLDLSCGIVGAFNDIDLQSICNIPKKHKPMIVMPIGYEK